MNTRTQTIAREVFGRLKHGCYIDRSVSTEAEENGALAIIATAIEEARGEPTLTPIVQKTVECLARELRANVGGETTEKMLNTYPAFVPKDCSRIIQVDQKAPTRADSEFSLLAPAQAEVFRLREERGVLTAQAIMDEEAIKTLGEENTTLRQERDELRATNERLQGELIGAKAIALDFRDRNVHLSDTAESMSRVFEQAKQCATDQTKEINALETKRDELRGLLAEAVDEVQQFRSENEWRVNGGPSNSAWIAALDSLLSRIRAKLNGEDGE